MKILSINSNQQSCFKQNVSFGTTSRKFVLPSGEHFGTNSWLFREDVDWIKLSNFAKSHFKDKPDVNVVQFAASDGSEAYTFIMSLLENSPKPDDEKFFPIMAYDIDPEITNAAKSGYLNTIPYDRIMLQIRTDNYKKYFSPTKEKLKINGDKHLGKSDRLWENGMVKTLKASKLLTGRVEFHKEDMYKILEQLSDYSNTILMCRNILGYFDEPQIETFIKQVSSKLKKGSLFIIGDHDFKNTSIDRYLNANNFKPVIKNVYQKL